MTRPRATPVQAWLGDPVRAAGSLGGVAVCLWLGWPFLQWAGLQAAWTPDLSACEAAAARGGACWGVVAEKARVILLGRYPGSEAWRPLMALMLMAVGLAYLGRALLALAAPSPPRVGRALAAAALAVGGAAAGMRGGFAGLPLVPTADWGGLPLTLLLAGGGLAGALPLGVALALGRQSGPAWLRAACVAYIELARGVPLVAVLFLASYLLPLLFPAQGGPDMLMRVLSALVLFAAAYVAEVVRGGLQTVPAGQMDAARALGLSGWQVQRRVVLPQALRVAVPSLINLAIGLLKDTSLVTVVSLYELTGSLQLALGGDPLWRSYYLEAYVFVAALYWVMCFGLSAYGRVLERRLRPAG